MSRKFSFESIEYLTEKLNNSQCLSHESLIYLTVEISELIFNLLQVYQQIFFCYYEIKFFR